MSADRRKFLETATAMTAGAVTGCTLPTTARDDGGMMFHIEPAFIPMVGSAQKFPVRRIYCVGRNYAAHSREMGSDPTRDPPFFFSEADGRDPARAAGRDHRPPLPARHQELSLRSGAGRRHRQARLQHPRRQGTGSCGQLCRGPGHDAPRPAAHDGRPEEAVGSGQVLRPCGGGEPPAPGGKRGPSEARCHLAEGERRDQAVGQHQGHDLVRRRTDRQPLAVLRAILRRHHLFRHAGKCRPRRAGGCDGGAY